MAALVDSWVSPLSLAQPKSASESENRTASKFSGELREPDSLLGSSELDSSNQTMVPGTSSRHPSRAHVHSPSSTSPTVLGQQLCPPLSGGANVNPPHSPSRQLASAVPNPPQNRHPFPTLPLPPPPDFSAMLTLLPENPLRRTNKLRKPNRISSSPPVLAPLSFIEEPELDLDFEQISHDVPRTSPHPLRQSLTNKSFHRQDAPPPEQCENALRQARKLTKHRRSSLAPIPQEQVVSSSSGAAAAAAVTGNPAAPVAAISQISSPISSKTPHRARSDVGHGIRHSVSIKRASIIRRLSMRSPKPSLESQATSSGLSSSTGPTTPVSGSMWTRWRGAVSDVEHDNTNEDPPLLLPLVRVTSPFSVQLPSKPGLDDKTPRVQLPPVRMDLPHSRPCTPTGSEPVDISNPIGDDRTFVCHRAKFTLEGNESEAELSNPPSPNLSTLTPGYLTPQIHSAPPSRSQSTHNPRLLSPLSRYEPSANPPRRRWTFAMAMTDEDITDEVLVMELERMRLRKEWSGSVDEMGEIWDPDYVLFGTFGLQELTDSPQEEYSPQRHLLEHPEHSLRPLKSPADISYTPSLPSFPHQHRNSSVPLPESGSTQQWQTARRVLLTCRELVRTERHYLASLQILLASETEDTPPLLMLRYAEELVKVSQLYLAQMEGNPSAWGVAAAFLGAEEAVDGAFVGWCGVVGMWFDEGPMKSESKPPPSSYPRRLSKPSKQKLADEFVRENAEEDESTKDRLKKIGSWRRSLTSIADLSANAPSTKKKEKGSAPPPSFSLYGHRQRRMSKTKKPPIRDLAILPTQRIMRYVLLYRDLLAHTPSTSPSRGLIKRAADAAFRIAQKCDRAQTNSAFIVDKRRDTAAPVKATSTTNSTPSSNSEGDADQLSSSIPKPDSSRSENS